MSKNIIKELTCEKLWMEAFPVMKQLRTHLDESTYVNLVKEAQEKEDYKMFGLVANGRIVAVTGFMPMITLYNGRFIWVCDLVTDQNERSKNYGEELLTFVHKWAGEHGFHIVSLSSGLQRTEAHRFYEHKMNYEKTSFVFLKKLEK
ncbi:GNAT family N-acetyltransferase [Bacillus sp. M6-12]|uniref:GNAT family N-acetyltransferase n=1 Tax=Bacillus sp. M6-12 TaxID=2054166 RepID=UPI0021559EED|nr:GNAT family N-acetyltransferase [Bacillus sp. M6-12]